MEKIAVHVPTEELAMKVCKKTGKEWAGGESLKSGIDSMFNLFGDENPCINIEDKLHFARKVFYESEGYTIQSAEEYLAEGRNMEFKVGDFVNDGRKTWEIGKMVGDFARPKGEEEWESGTHVTSLTLVSKLEKKKLKINKLKPYKKESDMKKVISDTFERTQDALLVEKHLGGQIVDTFVGGLAVGTFKKEILAEAKRLEAESTSER